MRATFDADVECLILLSNGGPVKRKKKQNKKDLILHFNWLALSLQARTYNAGHRPIPLIAHQRLVPVSAPPYRRSLYADALYADAMEPLMMVMPPRPYKYNSAAYFEDAVSSSMQVRIFLSFF